MNESWMMVFENQTTIVQRPHRESLKPSLKDMGIFKEKKQNFISFGDFLCFISKLQGHYCFMICCYSK